jgi:hypothetical protein
MAVTVLLGNLSANAGSIISLKGLIPAPIHRIINAVILAGHTVNEAGTATYDILTATSAVATVVDDYTITLNVSITTKDLLLLTYVPKTEYPAPLSITRFAR